LGAPYKQNGLSSIISHFSSTI